MPEEAPSGRGGVRGHRPSDRSVRPRLVAAPALLLALIHSSAWRDCLETPTHGPISSPSAASSPRRRRPPLWRIASRSPSSYDGYERSKRRCAPPPTSSATPGNPSAASASANPPPFPP